jgi:hypothetical protein
LLTRAEEDTDGNGRSDKWESYHGGVLQYIDLDTTGRGVPDRRFVYDAHGDVRLERLPEKQPSSPSLSAGGPR